MPIGHNLHCDYYPMPLIFQPTAPLLSLSQPLVHWAQKLYPAVHWALTDLSHGLAAAAQSLRCGEARAAAAVLRRRRWTASLRRRAGQRAGPLRVRRAPVTLTAAGGGDEIQLHKEKFHKVASCLFLCV